MVESLSVIKQVSEKLCTADCTLLKAEALFDFALNSLSSKSNELSQKLYDNLKQRISQRRTILSDALCFLSNYDKKTV